MNHRIKNLPIIVLVFGSLFFSVSYNIYQAKRIQDLENNIVVKNLLEPFNYEEIKGEILRLENIKYE